MLLEYRDRVLDLVDHVECVLVPGIREDDVDQGIGEIVPVIRRALERIPEVGSRIRDAGDTAP